MDLPELPKRPKGKKMERYIITAYSSCGDVAYTVVATTEQQMLQELKDGINDGFSIHIIKQVKKVA